MFLVRVALMALGAVAPRLCFSCGSGSPVLCEVEMSSCHWGSRVPHHAWMS